MKITKRQLGRIIKEEVDRVLSEQGGNPPPPKDSNWSEFAAAIDVGVLDLDEMAYELGFTDFYDMDLSISPSALADRDPPRFVQAAQDSSMMAQDMSRDQILTHAGVTGGM